MIKTLFDALFGWFFALFSTRQKALPTPEIKVIFSSHLSGLSLRVERATMLARADSVVHLTGVVINDTSHAIKKLSVVLHASHRGQSVGKMDFEMVESHQASLLPGDSHAWEIKMPIRTDADQITVTTDTVDTESPRARPSKEAAVTWDLRVPNGMALVFRERQHESFHYGDTHNGFCHLTIEVENLGREVSVLKLIVTFFDNAEEVIDEREVFAAWAGGPKIMTNERRLVHVITKVPSSYTSYLGRVVEIS